MTYLELKRQILNLGFESLDTYSEDIGIVNDAINRAMREITNMFPILGKYKIVQDPLQNLLGGTEKMNVARYDGTNVLSYRASGAKALYFECSGTGTLTIVDNDGTRTVALSSTNGFVPYRQFVTGDVELTFSGNYVYDVKNIALYGQLRSASVDDIPAFRKYIRYDFKELTKVGDKVMFIDFVEKIIEGDYDAGEIYLNIRDFRVEDRSVLILDGTKNVQYTVFYRENFTPITDATQDTFVMDIDYDREHLLPLLAAWYVWADDDPTKAAKYRNDYEDFAGRLASKASAKTSIEPFVNNLGW